MEAPYTIIVPTHNRRESVLRLLGALRNQDAPELLGGVVVADDGSTDGTLAAVRDFDLGCRLEVVRNEVPLGPAAARNLALRNAAGKWLLFLDDDVEPSSKLLRHHHQRRVGAGEGDCVLGRLELPSSVTLTPFQDFVWKYYYFNYEADQRGGELPPSYFSFANLSAPARLFETHGGFREELRFFEDLDLGLRFSRGGSRLLYAPRAVGWHHGLATFTGLCQRQEQIGPSAVRFMQLHPDHSEAIRIDRLPRWSSPRGAMKKLAFNPLTMPFWKMVARGSGALGLTRLAEPLCFQILSYHYYRGIARALASA